MKKTLAIILSLVMLLGAMPFGAFAASDYDRAKIAANDEATISALSEEQIAAVVLDWVDRQIAKATADFEKFEVEVMGTTIAVELPEIKTLDDVIAYKDFLKELGGDFAGLNTAALEPKGEKTNLEFIYGVIQFMADNSETFGKVFRWDDEVFDYGKVGEYILSLDTSVEENKKIVDFYNNYLIGNDIQSKFASWVAGQMNYTPAEGETFDDTLQNGIMAWFSGLCEENGILSAEALETLRAYDLRTSDIYSLVKSFTALVQADNQVKLDTYYNYLLDTVVRTLMKTMLGQKATTGAETAVPASFTTVYKDLALLKEISGATAYYKDGNNYYEITIGDGNSLSAKELVWSQGIEVNFEAPTATIYTGKNTDQTVQVYRPTSKDNLKISTYASAKNQSLMASNGIEMEFDGEAVTEEYAALMTDGNAKALSDSFGITVAQGENIISSLKLSFAEIEKYAEEKALEMAKPMVEQMFANLPFGQDTTVESIDITLSYKGWATEDEFIAQVVVDSVSVALAGSMASSIQSQADSYAKDAVATYIDNPVATVVVDGLSGNLDIDNAKELLDFVDTDFDIESGLLDFASNYDEYNGVVGQANRVLYGLVDMLVSDSGMEKLNLTKGNNDNFTANLQKICDTANDMMNAAEAVMNDEGLKDLLAQAGIDLSDILGTLDLDLLYKIDFSSVEALWVSVISLGLDMVDDGTNALISDIHKAVEGLTNLDAMAVAVTDYALAKCVPAINSSLGSSFTAPAKTDAATVSDGQGKDIIMTKLVDLIYDAAVWGVDFLNSTVNGIISKAEAETEADLPAVAFKLNVTKSADWKTTLKALVDRVYALADGIIIACDNSYTDTFDRISAVANAVLPLGSFVSNCASDKFAFDINKAMAYLFDDGLNGDLDGFLRLFETDVKTDCVAKNCSVTEALINALEHIVDSIFPDTVDASKYVNVDYAAVTFTETTVQEYFTSAENDAVIASNNMKSINSRKASLIPAALKLVREAGVLPYFAKCDKDHSALTDAECVLIPGTKATCSKEGKNDAYACPDCGYVIRGGETVSKNNDHQNTKVVPAKDATCTANGYTAGTYCNDCQKYISGHEVVKATGHKYTWSTAVQPSCTTDGKSVGACACGHKVEETIKATGHADANGDEICDNCNESLKKEDNSFLGKIRAFFQRILDFFKNLFK